MVLDPGIVLPAAVFSEPSLMFYTATSNGDDAVSGASLLAGMN